MRAGATADIAAVDDADVSVVIVCCTDVRLDTITSALTSLRKQSFQAARLILAVDNNESLANHLRSEFDWSTIVLNDGDPGSWATRNCGIEVVDTTFTAFLDADETADPDWLLELTRPFVDADVVGTGGRSEAGWSGGKPSWFPDEFAWVAGASYPGMPSAVCEVRDVRPANMAVRTAEFRKAGGFATEQGIRGRSFSYWEPTDLCRRMAGTARRWMYVPTAVTYLDVPQRRASLSSLAWHCFARGGAQALKRTTSVSSPGIETGRDSVLGITRTATRRLAAARWSASVQAAVVLIGLVSAVAGYLWTRVRLPVTADVPAEATHCDDTKPALVIECELTTPVTALADSLAGLEDYERVWVILRAAGKPLGIVDAPASLPAIEERVAAFRSGGLSTAENSGSSIAESATDANPVPSVTVAVCTRERPDDLVRLLDSLQQQRHEDFGVLLVDNAPTNGATRDVAERYRDRFVRLDYVVEPKPGLSQARNCALRHLDTELVAWIDDDETADANWLAEILDAFCKHPGAAAVSGSVLPAELETWPQWWFEQYGGHIKGRGFTGAVFLHGDTGDQSPLYPLPPFGVGANMAFRTSALAEVGGFDNGLGAGTATFGGEDVLVFSQLLLSGFTVVYEPAAMTRHYHRRTFTALERQMYGYGVGLTAFYMALLRWDWRLIVPLVALAPRAVGDVLGWQGSEMTTGLPDDFPSTLVRLKRRGMLIGPLAYWRGRRAVRSQLVCR